MGMNLKEATEHLEEGMEVIIECDGRSYEIAPSEDWVGGEDEEGYISLALGNVIYNDAESIIRKTIKFLEEDGEQTIITMG